VIPVQRLRLRVSTTITRYTSYPGVLTLVGDTEAVLKGLHSYHQIPVHFLSWCAHPCGKCRGRIQESSQLSPGTLHILECLPLWVIQRQLSRVSTTINRYRYTSYPGVLTVVGDAEAALKSLYNYQPLWLIQRLRLRLRVSTTTVSPGTLHILVCSPLWEMQRPGSGVSIIFTRYTSYPGVLTLVGDTEAALKSLHNYHQVHFIFGVLTLVGDTEVVP